MKKIINNKLGKEEERIRELEESLVQNIWDTENNEQLSERREEGRNSK